MEDPNDKIGVPGQPIPAEWEALKQHFPTRTPEVQAEIADLQRQIARQHELDTILEAFISALVINQSQAESIRKLARTIRHGAKFVDIHVRKDGQEYHFEADWLKQLFNPVRKP